MTAPDPFAEVARLRDPAGPWLHLLWGAPADARQFGWLLTQEGMVARVLRGPRVRTAFGLFDEAAAALQFPADLVEDWQAFGSLLDELSWLPGPAPQPILARWPVAAGLAVGLAAGRPAVGGPALDGPAPPPAHVLLITRASLLLAAAERAELASFEAAVSRAATGRIADRGPALHVVLADDAVGLATLRARLVALPAEVRDVVGWRPEEPALPREADGRVTFQAGPATPDEVDQAVAAAVPAEVVELRRAWTEYRGPAPGPVRTYGVVLERPDLTVAAAGLVSAVAASFDTGACTVLPVHRDAAARTDREAAFMAASIRLSGPLPPGSLDEAPDSVSADPAADPVTANPAPALPGGRSHDQSAACQGPDAAASVDLWTAASAVDSEPAQSPRSAIEPQIVAAGPDSAPDRGGNAESVRDGGGSEDQSLAGSAGAQADPTVRREPPAARVAGGPPDDAAAEPLGAARGGEPPGAEQPVDPGPAGPPEPGRSAGLDPAVERDGPRDEPGTPFGLVAADLDWKFAAGAPEHDRVDAAVVELARQSGMFQAVLRTWTRDPAAGWVRVLVGYATQAADPARASLVAAAQAAGAARTCVEVIAQAEVGEVHRWLEQQCVSLWRAAPQPPGVASPAAAPESDLADMIERTEVVDEMLDGGFTLVALTQTEPVVELSADQRDGRDQCDRALVEWASTHPNLLAAVRGAVTLHGERTRVYLLAVDPDADRPAVRRAASAVLRARGLARCGVELFCPIEPISRFHRDLFGKGAQLWRGDRQLTRPAPPAAGEPPADR